MGHAKLFLEISGWNYIYDIGVGCTGFLDIHSNRKQQSGWRFSVFKFHKGRKMSSNFIKNLSSPKSQKIKSCARPWLALNQWWVATIPESKERKLIFIDNTGNWNIAKKMTFYLKTRMQIQFLKCNVVAHTYILQ